MTAHTLGPAAERCATCGQVIETGRWHPVGTSQSAIGPAHIYPFCSERCLSQWETGSARHTSR